MPRPRSRPDYYLLSKVSTLYYTRGLTQQEIADRLHISRPKVSRLLQEALNHNIVRISIAAPRGLHLELEAELEAVFDLSEALVIDVEPGPRESIYRQIGTGAASYFARTLQPGETIGLGWGTTLDAMVQATSPIATEGIRIVQTLGGVGPPESGAYAADLVRRLADLLGASAVLLPAPGIVGTVSARNVLRKDPHVQMALQQYNHLDAVFIGIGSLQASPILRDSHYLPPEAYAELQAAGAIGHIGLRFFDAQGNLVHTSLDDRTLSITPEQLYKTPRVVGVAGGPDKVQALLGALRAGFLNVLITDQFTAAALLEAEKRAPAPSLEVSRAGSKKS
ncbi:MAG TPA: sugar-binding transcriptional regulator [Longimicrobiaceae bacterium]